MNIIIIGFLIIIYVSACRTQLIKKYEFENDGSGNYSFSVETGGASSTDFSHEQKGELKNENTDKEFVAVSGNYFYRIGDSGTTITVIYTADERGYRPKIYWSMVPRTDIRIGEDDFSILSGHSSGGKVGISDTVLGTLSGGNIRK